MNDTNASARPWLLVGWTVLVITLLVGGLGWRLFHRVANPQSLSTPTKAEVYGAAQKFVTETLQTPATAKYPPLDDPEVKVSLEQDKHVVALYVDAQNLFGAQVRSRFTVVLRFQTDTRSWEFLGLRELSGNDA